MVRLYLMRHGETVDNVNRILQGQTDGRLNDNGLRMAEEASRRMAGEAIDVFFSSDLGRCVDTCRIMARPHGKPIVQTPLLRERDWGSFTGKFIPDLQAVKQWPDDIESLESLKSRAKQFIAWLKATFPNQTVLAVGHGIVNKAIQSIYFGKPMNEIQKMTNAEVRKLVL